jgi:hypothetical protein
MWAPIAKNSPPPKMIPSVKKTDEFDICRALRKTAKPVAVMSIPTRLRGLRHHA